MAVDDRPELQHMVIGSESFPEITELKVPVSELSDQSGIGFGVVEVLEYGAVHFLCLA